MDYSAAERERAAEMLWQRAWGEEEPEYRPGKGRWVKNLLEGLFTPLSGRNTITLQCELNRAVDLLGGLLEEHCCDDGSADFDGTTTECTVCKPIRDFLSHYPEGELR